MRGAHPDQGHSRDQREPTVLTWMRLPSTHVNVDRFHQQSISFGRGACVSPSLGEDGHRRTTKVPPIQELLLPLSEADTMADETVPPHHVNSWFHPEPFLLGVAHRIRDPHRPASACFRHALWT